MSDLATIGEILIDQHTQFLSRDAFLIQLRVFHIFVTHKTALTFYDSMDRAYGTTSCVHSISDIYVSLTVASFVRIDSCYVMSHLAMETRFETPGLTVTPRNSVVGMGFQSEFQLGWLLTSGRMGHPLKVKMYDVAIVSLAPHLDSHIGKTDFNILEVSEGHASTLSQDFRKLTNTLIAMYKLQNAVRLVHFPAGGI